MQSISRQDHIAAISHTARKSKERLRRCGPIFAFVIIIFLLAGCAEVNQNDQPLSGHLLVVGSTALQPLVTDAAKRFMQQHPQAHLDVQGGGSFAGLNAVTSTDPAKQADIGDSDVYADPAQYPNPNLTDHLVCVVPFAIVVSPGITITSLNRSDIVGIFSTGTIKNWDQLGGPNLPIVPIVRTLTSGTRATFRRYVLGGLDDTSPRPAIDSSQDVLKAVAATPGAISYLALSVADATVRVIDIDNTSPSVANITSGTYPFWSFEHMYTLGEEDSNILLGSFLDFMQSSEVQNLAQQEHYIPIATMQLPGVATVSHAGDNGIALNTEESEVRTKQ
jgi:phosphate transport system substrate-binding protein